MEIARLRVAALLVLLVVVRTSVPAQSLQPSGAVNDFADVVHPGARAELDSMLTALATDAAIDVAVVTVPSLNGTTIDELAKKLFRDWANGRQRADKGVLIVVAPNLGSMRIEVGKGLDPILPRYLADRVMREDFAPAFQTQTPGDAIVYGTRKVADILRARKVATPPPAPPTVSSRLAEIDTFEWLLIGFAALFVGGAAFELGTGVGAKAVFPVMKGIVLAGFILTVQWWLLGPLAAAAVGGAVQLPLAVAGGLFGLRKGRSPRWRRTTRGGSGGRAWVWGTDAHAVGMETSSHSTSSDTSISSGGGGSSGDSGFGGGSSGGGGASGSY